MSKITIADLPENQTLDSEAMRKLSGGNSFMGRFTPSDPVRTFFPTDPIRTIIPGDPVRTLYPTDPIKTFYPGDPV